ncbi:MAG: hypothetical protein H7Y04_08035 [Verrucomicrobia bacterium]|nr:hypothetical protein [Cytophagales bacterium]
MKYILPIVLLLFKANFLLAQTDTIKVAEEDFGSYGDADNTKAKIYCTQKVLFLTPAKLITLGYETQLGYTISSKQGEDFSLVSGMGTGKVNSVRGLRLAFNAPVISRNKIIVNLGMNYWNSGFDFENTGNYPFYNELNRKGLRTFGLNTTIFKPFNEKHFLIANLSADKNGNYTFDKLNFESVTLSATAIFGWKKSDRNMVGIGATRTYRLGELIYVPVFFWNKTFNDRWGMEILFPARAAVRHNFSTKSLLQLGYELEGNSYLLQTQNSDAGLLHNTAIRRGEAKIRLVYERALYNFVWISLQGGLRVNGRFDVAASQNTPPRENYVINNTLGNPLYFNISLNLVSP